MKRILTVAIATLIAFGSIAGSAPAFGQPDLEANSEKVAR
ncbi:hypothetical protein JOF56_001085 [Kibdelosporangium banguiense]|uniref:Uncharacterized protein n=1 Tax=Kibdelosporangium banguiense TaxID=1365924 RepID=A0ABS4T8F5_9PSEU|nr:hypothetical protein [Kibdelosporangium banguiense]